VLSVSVMIMGKISKVVICGTKKSGKTSLLEQAIYGKLGVRRSSPKWVNS
jgi:GTPase SAR1 family protein